MEVDWLNAIGWCASLLFLTGLGLYIFYRTNREREGK